MSIKILRGLPLGLFLLLLSCNKDVENAKIVGFVFDNTNKKPIGNAKLAVTNWYYEGGDYDSYNKSEKYIIVSNADGRYGITFRKSAFVEVSVFKDGYNTMSLGKEIYKDYIELDFYLQRK